MHMLTSERAKDNIAPHLPIDSQNLSSRKKHASCAPKQPKFQTSLCHQNPKQTSPAQYGGGEQNSIKRTTKKIIFQT